MHYSYASVKGREAEGKPQTDDLTEPEPDPDSEPAPLFPFPFQTERVRIRFRTSGEVAVGKSSSDAHTTLPRCEVDSFSTMSKAFTKEDDDAGDAALQETPLLLPEGTKNYMTPTGAAHLRIEFENVSLARSSLLAKSPSQKSKELQGLDRRIRFLRTRIEHLEVVKPETQNKERVLFGAKVTLQDEDGETRRYQIVGIDEANPAKGLISWISPLARAMMNSKIGDVVTFRSAKGEEELLVTQLSY